MTTKTAYRWRRARPGLYHLMCNGERIGQVERGAETGCWYGSAWLTGEHVGAKLTLRASQNEVLRLVRRRA